MAVKSHPSANSDPLKGMISEIIPSEVISGRKKLLEITDGIIEDTYHRVAGERFRLREGDRERIAYLRILLSAVALHDSLLSCINAPSLEGLDFAAIEARHLREKEREIEWKELKERRKERAIEWERDRQNTRKYMASKIPELYNDE